MAPTTPVDIESLRKENEALKTAQAQASNDEKLIRSKMAAGLTREQAVTAIATQRKFDARAKEVAAQRGAGARPLKKA